MIDSTVEDLIDPVYRALKKMDENQLSDLADALHRLQIVVDEELIRRENGDEETEDESESEDLDDASRW